MPGVSPNKTCSPLRDISCLLQHSRRKIESHPKTGTVTDYREQHSVPTSNVYKNIVHPFPHSLEELHMLHRLLWALEHAVNFCPSIVVFPDFTRAQCRQPMLIYP